MPRRVAGLIHRPYSEHLLVIVAYVEDADELTVWIIGGGRPRANYRQKPSGANIHAVGGIVRRWQCQCARMRAVGVIVDHIRGTAVGHIGAPFWSHSNPSQLIERDARRRGKVAVVRAVEQEYLDALAPTLPIQYEYVRRV